MRLNYVPKKSTDLAQPKMRSDDNDESEVKVTILPDDSDSEEKEDNNRDQGKKFGH